MSGLRSAKTAVRGLTPKPLINAYHATFTWLAQAMQGFPSRHMVTVGVTGTDGKTSTTNYASALMETAGFKTGITSTALIKVGSKSELNPYKLTMLGRGMLARLLNQMCRVNTRYAFVETSSEGLAQYRHVGIAYDVAVFTNLAPEHLESHGSYEAYRAAKEKLFATLSRTPRKPGIKKIAIVNLDDKEAEHFLAYDADEKWGFTLGGSTDKRVEHVVRAKNYQCGPTGITFTLEIQRGERRQETSVVLQLVGIFNLKNALAAAAVAASQSVKIDVIKRGLESLKPVPGRMEQIVAGQPFSVIVDYAHAPSSLEMVYKTLREQLEPGKRLIALLGAAGGGRDKAKRPVLGKLAGKYADISIVTNEDPYDEDPAAIISQVVAGVRAAEKHGGVELYQIPERRDGMRKAFELAKPGDIVVITGKGCEPVIMSKGGVRIPHDDRVVARELLQNPTK